MPPSTIPHLAALLEALPQPVMLMGLDGTILVGNRTAGSLLGNPVDPASREKLNDLRPGIREALRPAIDAALRNGAATAVLGAGTDHPALDVALRPVRDDAGVILGVLAIVHGPEPDTAQVQVQLRALDEELQDTNARLRQQLQELEAAEEANERKNQFMAMLAHELRNPLSVVVNAFQIIRRRAGEDRQVERAVQLGERQVRHTAKLLDDLLDVSRIVLGKIQLRPELVDLRDVVRRVVEAGRFAARSQMLLLKVDLPPDPLVVHGDPTRLEQCIGNLLSNAVKYTPRGGSVGVGAHRDGNSAVLVVRDSGIGIAPEMLHRVFDLFAQADASLARARGGLGIGLTLARHLTDLHGGTLTARSAGLGRGSEFEVRLPALDVTDAPAAPPSSPAPAARRRVLVVEDNRDARETLHTILSLSGHSVADTGDGASAVRLAVEWAPDVVLIDIGLPEMDGYEVARQIRNRAGDLMRLVALTGYSDAETRRRVIEAGFTAHLVKPASPEEIDRLLARL